MDTESGSTPAPTSQPVIPPPTPPARPAATGSLMWMLPLLCLVATGGFWWQTSSELSTLRSQQREILEIIDAARGASNIDVSDDPTLGSDDAIVTLIEFSDYECPFCVRHFSQTMPLLNDRFIATGRIQYVFKDFPIDQLHPEALRAHQAARCAAEQDKFWEMHMKMFSPAGTHTLAALEAHATSVGVAVGPYRECMTSGRTIDAVKASVQTAVQLGANGTPSFFVGLRDPQTNTVRIVQALSGAHPIEEFEKLIVAAEARVAR